MSGVYPLGLRRPEPSYTRCEPVFLALGRQMQTGIVDFEASLVYIGQPGLHSENLSQKQTKQLVS